MLLAVGGSDNLIGKGEEHPVLLRRLNHDLQIQERFPSNIKQTHNNGKTLIINQLCRNHHKTRRSKDLRNGAADSSRHHHYTSDCTFWTNYFKEDRICILTQTSI